VFHPLSLEYLAKVSALRTHPIIVPKCGELFTYGNAEVIKLFFGFFGSNGTFSPSFSLLIF